jgi:CubicO group peptidase (beta-lactamase class C family)
LGNDTRLVKIGLLYLHKGNWNGAGSRGELGEICCNPPQRQSLWAQFWLNAGGKFPDAPRDMFYCSGFQGQMVAIIPSLDLVIVRMGLKEDPDFDFNGF